MEPAQKNDPELHKTPLWALHVSLGARMVPFAGYDMPVQYDGMGVLKEHIHTRTAAGLFDVSHMGQAVLSAENADPARALEKIVPGDIAGLKPGQMRYTLLLNDDGGIIDDLMVTRWDGNTLFLVVNAACKDKDFAYIRKAIGGETKLEYLADRALLALQGPKAEDVLKVFFPAVTDMVFMTAIKAEYKGHECFVSRSGYTGEDGFEISVPENFAEDFAKELLAQEGVKAIGLGARDSLRLEAGLCLYGHDLDDETTPVEAALKWTVPKRRREEGGFAGAEKILKQFKEGTSRLRVGIKPEGRAPIRENTELFAEDGAKVGVITSGGFGPTFDAPVAMGYVDAAHAKAGTKLHALLRGTKRPCEVAAMPFVPQSYKK
ncbi:MAG: glycine cleavage system aminomethyltransferase GcvT [Alphaproteobacteria bacterium]|nr:glycine cleavage system aminomethyltransferase GcvT [Alphaproteobacteria bacterium]